MSKIRVMVVDDSTIVRGLMQRAIKADPELDMVATAVDGQMALDVLKRTAVDVVILDVEMPVMDGLTALPLILQTSSNPRVIMASTLTMRNAEISVRAMELGASDYIAKPGAQEAGEVEVFYRELISKIKALGTTHVAPSTSPKAPNTTTPSALSAAAPLEKLPSPIGEHGLVVKQSQQPPVSLAALAIASSTGGPQALLHVFKELKGKPLRIPIFITQHMPANFTTILAQHLTQASGYDCHEAVDGEVVKTGVVYLAPGDFHMTAERIGTDVMLRLDKNPQENFCRPSADPMLRSLAKIYGNKLLVTVLTGLGSDGARGAVDVVRAGGTVIAQDEATSVVYGMPKAVVEAKLTSAVFPLPQIPSYLARAVT